MAENEREAAPEEPEVAEPDLRDRRDFLIGLGKWSKAVIGGVVLGGVMLPGKEAEAVGWSNHGNWVNLGGGGPGRGDTSPSTPISVITSGSLSPAGINTSL